MKCADILNCFHCGEAPTTNIIKQMTDRLMFITVVWIKVTKPSTYSKTWHVSHASMALHCRLICWLERTQKFIKRTSSSLCPAISTSIPMNMQCSYIPSVSSDLIHFLNENIRKIFSSNFDTRNALKTNSFKDTGSEGLIKKH